MSKVRSKFQRVMVGALAQLVLINSLSAISYAGPTGVLRGSELVVNNPTSTNFNMTDSKGMVFFSPYDIFNRNVQFSQIPEMEVMNAYMNEDIKHLMWNLASEGIAVGLGINSNRGSFFNLYDPTSVDILLDEPAAEFGMRQPTLEAEVGKMHFITHDSTHMYAGQLGPRLVDLKDSKTAELSKKRMLKILLDKEAIASAWSTAHHVRWYWNWRYKNQGGKEIEKFQNHNQGGASFAKLINNNDFMDLLFATMHGDIWTYAKVIQKHIDYDHYRAAREVGVPMLFPDLGKKLTPLGEKFVMKYGFSLILAIGNYFDKKTGYVGFSSFAKVMTDFYYSNWYVKWADAFSIGLDLDTMEAHLKKISDDYRQDKFMKDVKEPAQGIFEVMHVKNAVAQFGRKIIEFLELDSQNPGLFTAKDIEDFQVILREAIDINNEILAVKAENKPVTTEEIKKYQASVRSLMARTAVRFPVEKFIPIRLRLGFADYTNFWTDSFAVVLPRPPFLTKFLSERGIWAAALRQRIEREVRAVKGEVEPKAPTFENARTISDMADYLGALYNKERKGAVVPNVETDQNFYLNRLETFRQAVRAQVYDVFIPQIQEYPQLNADQRIELINTADAFGKAVDSKLFTFRELYTARFIEYNRDPEIRDQLNMQQTNIKWSVERSLNAMMDILDNLDQIESKKALKKVFDAAKIISSNTKIVFEETQLIEPSIMDRARITIPMKAGLPQLGFWGGIKLIVNENLTKLINWLPLKPFSRDLRAEPDFEMVNEKGEKVDKGFAQLPANAVVILAMNHDHAGLDARFVTMVSKKLGIKRNLLLTDKDAWPQFQIHENKDPDVFLIQDPQFKNKVMTILENHTDGRAGFTIFPEGGLPFWGTQFPMVSQFGAFSIARKTAASLAGKKPVYFVEIQGNFLESVTAPVDKPVPVKLSVYDPVLVPTTPVGQRDAWVEKMRTKFEQDANEYHRRGKQYDLIDRVAAPDQRIRPVREVREYMPVQNSAIFERLQEEKARSQRCADTMGDVGAS